MSTESKLNKIHVFQDYDSYEQNKTSVGESDIALVPDKLDGTDYTVNRTRGIALYSSEPSTVPNGCIVGVYE